MICALTPDFPSSDTTLHWLLKDPTTANKATLAGYLTSFVFDWQFRTRVAGATGATALDLGRLSELVVPISDHRVVSDLALRLALNAWIFAPVLVANRDVATPPPSWPLTPHERRRLRAMHDAIVAALYGLDRDDFACVLKDCDHPAEQLSDKAFCRQLDPKDFWRVDKTSDPELRHTVLSLAAFDDLQAAIAAAGDDSDAGIQAFCDQHDGDGWILPETVCLADLGLTRTVDVGAYDERARTPQPVRSRMGERFLDWQLAQTPEESWAECERHAKAILESMPAPAAPPATKPDAEPPPRQPDLFDEQT